MQYNAIFSVINTLRKHLRNYITETILYLEKKTVDNIFIFIKSPVNYDSN